MEYNNYLTTPSGRYCEVKDIKNADYLVLVKFLEAQKYDNFFMALNEVVKRSIPDFDDFDIVEKAYVYIAMCMYSIRPVISVNNKTIGSQEVNLSLILDNIEGSYIRSVEYDFELQQGIILRFGYPKTFRFDGGTIPVLDFFSGLVQVTVHGRVLTKDETEKFKKALHTKHLAFIDDFCREKFVCICDIFHGVVMNKMEMNILGQSLLFNVITFYSMNLEVFYQIMYAMIKHVRMSYSDFMKISHAETSILLKLCSDESQKISDSAKGGNIGTIGRVMEDEF